MKFATTACNSVAIGQNAMAAQNVSGIYNIAIGLNAGCSVTTGYRNTYLGQGAGRASSTGCYNIAIGDNAMQACDGASSNNVAIGRLAGCNHTTAQNNVAIGQGTNKATTTGCHNISIGYDAGATITTACKIINIGCNVQNTTAATTCIGGTCVMATQFTATSDCRSKKNIKDLPYGLDFINLLRPVSYKWKPQADKLDKNGNLIAEGEKNHAGPRSSFGLLGQEVKGALDKLGLSYNDFAGYSDKEEEHGPSGWKPSYQEENKTISLAYDDFIAPLIKSVQELSAEVTELKAQLRTT